MQDKIPEKKKIKTKSVSSSDEKSITLQEMEEMDTNVNEFINSYNANFLLTKTHHMQYNKSYFFFCLLTFLPTDLLTPLQTSSNTVYL